MITSIIKICNSNSNSNGHGDRLVEGWFAMARRNDERTPAKNHNGVVERMDLQVSGVSRDFARRVVPEKVYGLGWSRVVCIGLYIGRMEDKMETTFMGYVGIMEKNMETTIMGYIVSVIAIRQLEATQHANKWKPLDPRQIMWCWLIGYRTSYHTALVCASGFTGSLGNPEYED